MTLSLKRDKLVAFVAKKTISCNMPINKAMQIVRKNMIDFSIHGQFKSKEDVDCNKKNLQIIRGETRDFVVDKKHRHNKQQS
jgi:hypothetical protein